MTCPFDITVATNSVRLDAKRQGEAPFTVFNRSGQPVHGRAQLAPQEPQAAAWLGVTGEAERNFAIAGTEQYSVRLLVPADAPAGNYAFRLDMVGIERPDEDFCAGPSVTFEVPEPIPAKPFPWKWVVIAVVALLAIGAAAFFLWPRTVPVPSLAGLTVNDAHATLEALNLAEGTLSEGDGGDIDPGLVIASTPGPATAVARNSAVDLVIAAAPTPTPTAAATPTITPSPTPTPDLPATATAEAELAAQATATALAAAIGKYVGTWELSGDGFPYITKLSVSHDNQTVNVAIAGSAFVIVTSNGGLASGTCVAPGACAWGNATLEYNSDPLQFNITTQAGLSQRLTLSSIDSSTLSAVYRVRFSTTWFPSSNAHDLTPRLGSMRY